MTKKLNKKEEKPQLVDPSKLEEMSKEDLIKVVQQALLPINDPEKYKEMVRSALPEFAKEVESTEIRGTAIFEASQQMLLVIFDCLRRYHNLSYEDLKRLNKEMTDVLRGVAEFEDAGLSMLSQHSMTIVGDNVQDLGIEALLTKIAKIREQKARMTASGIEYDKIPEKPFLKRPKN